VGEAIKSLRGAFPKMGDDFFGLLYKRIGANEFSAQRLDDAITNVIDNFRYKELNVADIISFDKRIKLYTYNQVCTEVGDGRASMDDYKRIVIPGRDKSYYAKKVDLINEGYESSGIGFTNEDYRRK
jgi:hypothetical protein